MKWSQHKALPSRPQHNQDTNQDTIKPNGYQAWYAKNLLTALDVSLKD
jgi:hypothetical protein